MRKKTLSEKRNFDAFAQNANCDTSEKCDNENDEENININFIKNKNIKINDENKKEETAFLTKHFSNDNTKNQNNYIRSPLTPTSQRHYLSNNKNNKKNEEKEEKDYVSFSWGEEYKCCDESKEKNICNYEDEKRVENDCIYIQTDKSAKYNNNNNNNNINYNKKQKVNKVDEMQANKREEENKNEEKKNGIEKNVINNHNFIENDFYDKFKNCEETKGLFSDMYGNDDEDHQLLVGVPHSMKEAFKKTLSFWGLERHVQLLRLVQLLGDLEDGSSLPLLQVLGLAGMGKTGLVREFLMHTNTLHAYVNCAVAGYQGGRAAREVIYERILKQIAEKLKNEKYASQHKPDKQTHSASFISGSSLWKISKPDEFVCNLSRLIDYYKLVNSEINNKITQEEKEEEKKEEKYFKSKFKQNKKKTLIIVLDNAKHLAKYHPHILFTLLRLRECMKEYDMQSALTEEEEEENKSEAKHIKKKLSIKNIDINICIILISRSPLPDECLQGHTQPPAVWFDSYTKEMCKNILDRSFYSLAMPTLKVSLPPTAAVLEATNAKEESKWGGKFCIRFLDKNNNNNNYIYEEEKEKEKGRKEEEMMIDIEEKNKQEDIYMPDLVALWTIYTQEFLSVMYKGLKSDFHELKFCCRQLWAVFVQPVFAGKVQLYLQDMGILKRLAGPHFARALRNHCSHYMPDLRDSTLLDFSSLCDIKAARVELAYWGKVLLFSAFLSSQNNQKNDKKLFNHFVGRVFHVGRTSKNATLNIHTQRKGGWLGVFLSSPRPFTFNRWMCITDCLSLFLQNTSIELNAPLFGQISSLIRIGFLRVLNNTNMGGGNNALNNMSSVIKQAVNLNSYQWNASTPSVMNSNNNNNSNGLSSNMNCQKCNHHLSHVFDFDSKIAFQAPFDLIEEISKDLKIPLEDALLF